MSKAEKIFLVCIVLALGVIAVFVVRAYMHIQVAMDQDKDTPTVTCECTCPKPECTGADSIVADGYNVNISLQGNKWEPYPPLDPEEEDYVTLCRRESRELIHHPDLTLTKCYNFLHECQDDIYEARSGFDDEAAQTCWQQQAF